MSKLADKKLGEALDTVKKPTRGITGHKRGDPPPMIGHGPGLNETCAACKHPARVALDALYLKWRPIDFIERLSGVPREALETHFSALDLDVQRAGNTPELISALMELKMGTIKAQDISVKDLVGLIKEMNKITGKVKPPDANQGPQVVIIQGIPGRQQLIQDGDTPGVGEGTVVKVLGPGGKTHE